MFKKRDFGFLNCGMKDSEGFQIPYYLALYIYLFSRKKELFSNFDCIKFSVYLFDDNNGWLGDQVRNDKLIFDILTSPIIYDEVNVYAYHNYAFNNLIDEANKSLGMKRFITELYTTNLFKKHFAKATYENYSSESNYLKSDNFTITNIFESVLKIHFSSNDIVHAEKDREHLHFLIACVIFNFDDAQYYLTKLQIRELESSSYVDSNGRKINKPFLAYLVSLYNFYFASYLLTLEHIKLVTNISESSSYDVLKKYKAIKIG